MSELQHSANNLESQIKREQNQSNNSKALSDQIHGYLFNVHAFRTEKECFEKLRHMTEVTNDNLEEWCRQQRNQFTSARTDVRTNYLQHLREFLMDYTQIRRFLRERSDKFRTHITDIKRRQAETQQLLGTVQDNDS